MSPNLEALDEMVEDDRRSLRAPLQLLLLLSVFADYFNQVLRFF